MARWCFRSYKPVQGRASAKMDTTLSVEDKGTTRSKLTGVESTGEPLLPQPREEECEKWRGKEGVLTSG